MCFAGVALDGSEAGMFSVVSTVGQIYLTLAWGGGGGGGGGDESVFRSVRLWCI